jgi:hypothetical protein
LYGITPSIKASLLSTGRLFCYLCSLRIYPDQVAHFEHVIGFLSALVKGLIPVDNDGTWQMLAVQLCLGEWSHHHCNTTCKGEMDLTNNHQLNLEERETFDGLQASIPQIIKLLKCIWNNSTDGGPGVNSARIHTELRSVYGTEKKFLEHHVPKLVARVNMCTTMIVQFVDYRKYTFAKAFMQALADTVAAYKPKRNHGGELVEIPVEDILKEFFKTPGYNPLNLERVGQVFAPRGVINPVLGKFERGVSRAMYLDLANKPREQSTEGDRVHPLVIVRITDEGGYKLGPLVGTQGDAVIEEVIRVKNEGGGGAAAASASAESGGKKRMDDDSADLGGSRRNKVRGAVSSTRRRQRRQQRQEKKLRTQKAGRRRRRPHVTTEIVPYQP